MAPTTTLAPAPTFEASAIFGAFSDNLQAVFTAAVADEFNPIPEKAGINVAVFDGERLWTHAMGIASASAEMKPTTPVNIRSTSKTVLSALILTQVEDGLYQLTDSLETVLTGHPDYPLVEANEYINKSATVGHLLSQTSGMTSWLHGRPTDPTRDTLAQLDIILMENWRPALNLAKIPGPFVNPGIYEYSATNTVLLGLIAQHHGGKQVNTLYQETFFEPLGISAGLQTEVVPPPDMARPYKEREFWNGGPGFGDYWELAPFDGWTLGSRVSWVGAGIVSTPENTARWGYELYSPNGSAISEEVRAQLIDSLQITTDIDLLGSTQYGYMIAQPYISLPDGSEINAYGHPGGEVGWNAWIYYSPALDVALSLHANAEILHPGGRCGYRGQYVYVSVEECIAGRIFGALSGL